MGNVVQALRQWDRSSTHDPAQHITQLTRTLHSGPASRLPQELVQVFSGTDLVPSAFMTAVEDIGTSSVRQWIQDEQENEQDTIPVPAATTTVDDVIYALTPIL